MANAETKTRKSYPWIQALEHNAERCLPWKCRDERTGTLHLFKTWEDVRAYAEAEGIRCYL